MTLGSKPADTFRIGLQPTPVSLGTRSVTSLVGRLARCGRPRDGPGDSGQRLAFQATGVRGNRSGGNADYRRSVPRRGRRLPLGSGHGVSRSHDVPRAIPGLRRTSRSRPSSRRPRRHARFHRLTFRESPAGGYTGVEIVARVTPVPDGVGRLVLEFHLTRIRREQRGIRTAAITR